MEIVGVTSTEKTYSVGFTFLESEKEENVTWALEVCRKILKDKENTPKVIVIDRNTVLMSSVANVFPTSCILLCRYYIIKNVRSRVKPAIGTKQIKGEDRKMVKGSMIVVRIMNAENITINSYTKELYDDVFILFKKVCEKSTDLLKYVESTILDQVNEKIVYA